MSGWNYNEAFSRNEGLVNTSEQQVLKNTTIGIPGMGGVGGAHLLTLARMGVANFKIMDPDTFDTANTNRQYGCFVSTKDQPKAAVMEDLVRDINPEVNIWSKNEYLNSENAEEFFSGVDIIVDSLDAFAIDARLLLFKEAYKRKVPVVTAGPIGFSCSMLVQLPGGMSLHDYLNINDETSKDDKFISFLMGLTPAPLFFKYMDSSKANFKEERGPSISSSVALCSGFAASEVLKILLKRGEVKALPHYHYYDSYLGIFKKGYIPFGNKNPWQKIKINKAKKIFAT